LTDLGTKSEM